MRERLAAFDNPERDARLRCILCESLLPAPPMRANEPKPDPSVCQRCWALTPDERRLLRDRAMSRVLSRDYSR